MITNAKLNKIKQKIAERKLKDTEDHAQRQVLQIMEAKNIDSLKKRLGELEESKHELFLRLKQVLAQEAQEKPKEEPKEHSDPKQVFLHIQ